MRVRGPPAPPRVVPMGEQARARGRTVPPVREVASPTVMGVAPVENPTIPASNPVSTPVGPEYAELAGFFDDFADDDERWRRRNRTYHRLVQQVCRFFVPPGNRVLEVGSGRGELLAALEPSEGVGVDVSARMVETARRLHPDLRFEQLAGEDLELGTTFDYIVLSDLMPYVHDLQAL